MKTRIFFLLQTLTLFLFVSNIAIGKANLNSNDAPRVDSFEIQDLMSEYTLYEYMFKIEYSSLKPGLNLLARDLRSKNDLFLVVKEIRGQQIVVSGFSVRTRQGQMIQLDKNLRPSKAERPFPCPENWKGDMVCYTHSVFKETICYTLCQPGKLILTLPSKW